MLQEKGPAFARPWGSFHFEPTSKPLDGFLVGHVISSIQQPQRRLDCRGLPAVALRQPVQPLVRFIIQSNR